MNTISPIELSWLFLGIPGKGPRPHLPWQKSHVRVTRPEMLLPAPSEMMLPALNLPPAVPKLHDRPGAPSGTGENVSFPTSRHPLSPKASHRPHRAHVMATLQLPYAAPHPMVLTLGHGSSFSRVSRFLLRPPHCGPYSLTGEVDSRQRPQLSREWGLRHTTPVHGTLCNKVRPWPSAHHDLLTREGARDAAKGP